jgi:hypothetical protein
MTPDMIRIATTGAFSPLLFAFCCLDVYLMFLYPVPCKMKLSHGPVLLKFYDGRYVFC